MTPGWSSQLLASRGAVVPPYVGECDQGAGVRAPHRVRTARLSLADVRLCQRRWRRLGLHGGGAVSHRQNSRSTGEAEVTEGASPGIASPFLLHHPAPVRPDARTAGAPPLPVHRVSASPAAAAYATTGALSNHPALSPPASGVASAYGHQNDGQTRGMPPTAAATACQRMPLHQRRISGGPPQVPRRPHVAAAVAAGGAGVCQRGRHSGRHRDVTSTEESTAGRVAKERMTEGRGERYK